MAFAGGIKIFETNKALYKDGASVTVSTGSASKNYMLDRNPFTVWRSVGSNDSTTETITITLPSLMYIDRLALIGHNFKDFDIQWQTFIVGTWNDFTSVVGLDGSLGSINHTTYDKSVAYYEFDSVQTQSIRIRADKTQIVDAEKYLNSVIVTTIIGTMSGFPIVQPLARRNSKVQDMLSGRKSVSKSIETFSCAIDFAGYPTAYTADLQLMYTLTDRDEPFQVWVCGGNFGSPYFGHTLRGFRLQDFITMHVTADPEQSYQNNIYIGPIEASFVLEEVTV